MSKKYLAEGVGTFALAFVVLATSSGVSVALAIPVLASLTLALFVYTIGAISGSHINPAITIGLLSINKIPSKTAAFYIVAQIFGAAMAVVLAKMLLLDLPASTTALFDVRIFLAEALGTFFFAFGLASVVFQKVRDTMSGLVIGSSLLLGIMVATLGGAAGILNPAVAFALNSVTALYVLAPVVGSVCGFQVYRYLIS
jgi:glycerol uptake facilitator-like aquaporin